MEISIGIYALIFIFFFLFIPGFICRRFYYNGEFSKQVSWNNNKLSNILSSLFVGILLSLSFVSIFNLLSSSTIDIDSILTKFDSYFISSPSENKKLFDGFTITFSRYYLPFICGVYSYAVLVGFFFYRIVLILGLDTKMKFLRFNNNWHYLFTGKILKFKKLKQGAYGVLNVKHTFLDILVADKSEKPTLYSGLFADYDLNCENINKLEKIYLFKAGRYKKNQDGTVDFKSIPGNIFTIMGENIININCTYVCYDEDESWSKKFRTRKQLAKIIQLISALFFLTILISFVFSFNLFRTSWYENIISQSVWIKILTIFGINVSLGILTPFEINEKEKKVKFIDVGTFIALLIIDFIVFSSLYFLWKP